MVYIVESQIKYRTPKEEMALNDRIILWRTALHCTVLRTVLTNSHRVSYRLLHGLDLDLDVHTSDIHNTNGYVDTVVLRLFFGN